MSSRTSRSTSSNAAKGFTGRCLFCDRGPQSKKDMKRSYENFEKLSYSKNTKEPGETVHKAVEIRGDDKIALLTCTVTDFVTREICYYL